MTPENQLIDQITNPYLSFIGLIVVIVASVLRDFMRERSISKLAHEISELAKDITNSTITMNSLVNTTDKVFFGILPYVFRGQKAPPDLSNIPKYDKDRTKPE